MSELKPGQSHRIVLPSPKEDDEIYVPTWPDGGEWHKYPEEQPNKEGRYLVCYPLGMIPPAPFIFIARWGRSEECEWHNKSLKRKKAYWYNIDDEYGDCVLNNVYAWMPLPEPMPLPTERKEIKDD